MPDAPLGKVKTRQFGELDHTELVRLLDTLDDERSKARFRESVYISLFFWIAVVAVLIFAPRYLPRSPHFVTPSAETNHQLTNLTIPPDVQRAMQHAPHFKATPKAAAPASGSAGSRLAPAPPPPTGNSAAPPAPQTAPQAAAPAGPPPPPAVVQQSPLPSPRTPPQNVAALPSAPAPSAVPARPSFGNPNTSARDLVRQAGQGPRTGALDDGPGGVPIRHGLGAGVEILSDTQGVDFNEYLKKIKAEINANWEPLIPEEARPPLNKPGETQLQITILPDGRLHVQDGVHDGMILVWSTHDDAINRSCWGSVTGVGQFPPLPSQFHGPELVLRITYLVNMDLR